MAVGRPDDLDPKGWFEGAVRIDQTRATNAAFQASVQPALVVQKVVSKEELLPSIKIAEELLTTPKPSLQSPDVLDIKGMSADDIRTLRQQLFGIPKEFPAAPVNMKVVSTPISPKAPTTPPTSPANQFQKLPVEEVSEDTSMPAIIMEATCKRPPRRPQWEKHLPKQPKIGLAEVSPLSLHL